MNNDRITVIDALRGFALLGVILVHMLEHFGYAVVSLEGEDSLSKWDNAIHWFTDRMIRGKFISIFSFLFGLSFYIQMERASKKGIDFRKRFLWRMLLLFVIGLIGISFTYVDILTIYAVFGVVLVFLFPLKNRALMTIVCILLMGVPNWLIIGFDNIRFDNTVNPSPMEAVIPIISEQQVDNKNTLETTTFFRSAKENLTVKTLEKLKFQFIYSSTGYLILALFIMGFIVGRLRFFEQVHIKKKRNIMLLFLFLVSTLILVVAIKFIPNIGGVSFIALARTALTNISIITLSASLAMGFISLYQVDGVRRYLNLLTPYGRMGLTNYEMQNVMGAILFSAWGVGSFFGSKGAASLFVLGLMIYFLQVIISKYWMRCFLYGPFEWLWRSGTYLKWQPFKRKQES